MIHSCERYSYCTGVSSDVIGKTKLGNCSVKVIRKTVFNMVFLTVANTLISYKISKTEHKQLIYEYSHAPSSLISNASYISECVSYLLLAHDMWICPLDFMKLGKVCYNLQLMTVLFFLALQRAYYCTTDIQ